MHDSTSGRLRIRLWERQLMPNNGVEPCGLPSVLLHEPVAPTKKMTVCSHPGRGKVMDIGLG
jgi:hypothetical protein